VNESFFWMSDAVLAAGDILSEDGRSNPGASEAKSARQANLLNLLR
jgi:hypothetical protein